MDGIANVGVFPAAVDIFAVAEVGEPDCDELAMGCDE